MIQNYLVNSPVGRQVDSNISDTKHGYEISRIPVSMSPETILHIHSQSFRQRITQHESGPAEPLIEREPIIRHEELRMPTDVNVLGVIISSKNVDYVIHHENGIVVSHDQPPKIFLIRLLKEFHDSMNHSDHNRSAGFRVVQELGQVVGDPVRG